MDEVEGTVYMDSNLPDETGDAKYGNVKIQMYSSSSTEGCNQTDRAEMDMGAEYFSDVEGGWSRQTEEDCDLDDLLSQFENYFKNRFEAELDNFRVALGSVIEEQQSHIRQIVHTAIREQSALSQTSADEVFVQSGQENLEILQAGTETQKMSRKESGGSPSSLENLEGDTNTKLSLHQTHSSQAEQMLRIKKDQLLELVTLSCSVSTLLAKPQFRS